MNANKKVFAFVLLVLALLLATSCIPITKKGAGANATGAADGEGEDGDSGADEDSAAISVGIEVSINNATKNSTVHYFLDGIDETFTVKGTDADLIIWEIAKKYNVSLNKVRRTIAFDGEKYSSELWDDPESDAVPAEGGAYSDDGDGADAADSGDELWFDAYIADGKGYTTVHAYRGDDEIEEFRINFEDKDVVIIDIKNKYSLTMAEARAAIKFDGKWYVSRSNLALTISKTTPESAEMRALAASLPYLAEKDEGFLRGVACDLNNSLVKIKFTNTWNKTLLLFADRKPQIPDSLRFVLNGKTLYNLDCGRDTAVNNSIDAGATLECIKGGAYFIKSRPEFYSDKLDRMYVTMIGVSEYLDFECK